MSSAFVRIILACLCLLLLFSSQAPAEEAPLLMGVFPRRDAVKTTRMFQPLAAYLTQQLGRPVQLETTKDFSSFWKNVAARRYDIVHFNQYHYVKSHKEYGYQVIAKNIEFGAATIAGAILVRRDAGIRSVRDLQGKRIVFGGGPKAMQSYIVASYLLHQGGLHKGDYIEEFAKNPPNAILSAYYKQSAAAGAGDKVLQLGIVRDLIDVTEMKYLARGRQLPHLPWAVSGAMPEALRAQVQTALVRLKDNKEGRKLLGKVRLSGFALAEDTEYEPHREIIQTVLGEQY